MNARETLSKYQLKYSKQREILLEILQDSHEPMSVDDLLEQLRLKNVSMNQSTVYRIIDQFCAHRIVEKTSSTLHPKHFYAVIRSDHHHYLYCQVCHVRIPLDACPMEAWLKDVEDAHGFKMTQHHIEIIGLCAECQQKISHSN